MTETALHLPSRAHVSYASAPWSALVNVADAARRRSSILASLMLLQALALANGAWAADVPAAVSVEGKKEVLRLHAEGVQIYECKADASGAQKWQFREPLAVLLDDGTTIGRHFAGPTWEMKSGSVVVGKVEAQAPGATADDIPLLKLNVTEMRGAGEFTDVATIQRLETKGGAFDGSCNTTGELHLEPYAADYVFLGN